MVEPRAWKRARGFHFSQHTEHHPLLTRQCTHQRQFLQARHVSAYGSHQRTGGGFLPPFWDSTATAASAPARHTANKDKAGSSIFMPSR